MTPLVHTTLDKPSENIFCIFEALVLTDCSIYGEMLVEQIIGLFDLSVMVVIEGYGTVNVFNTAVLCMCECLYVSLSEVFGEEGCVPGAGRGPHGGSSSGQPAIGLCATAAEEPNCSLAAHNCHHHHGLLSALWPQCCKIFLFTLGFSHFQWNPVPLYYFTVHFTAFIVHLLFI